MEKAFEAGADYNDEYEMNVTQIPFIEWINKYKDENKTN